MASSNSEEDRLKAEIAKLSGAIQTHKQHQGYHQPYASRGRGHYSARPPAYRGGYASASASARGRGRGAASIPPRNRTLILNDSSPKPNTAQSTSSPGASEAVPGSVAQADAARSDAAGASTSSAATASTDAWIKRKSTHNMSLVSASTFQRTEPARLAALEATRKAKAQAHTTQPGRTKPAKPSSSVRRGDNMGEVVIDGVVFEFDPSGTKLVKKEVQPSRTGSEEEASSSSAAAAGASSSSSSATTAVPLKTSINGQDYIRTKRGNLISAELLAKRRAQREAQAKMGRLDKMVGQISAMQAARNAGARQKPGSRKLDAKKARTLCTFFNRTGQCKRGLSCPYRHDSAKIALCPKVLRPGGCTMPKGTCPLSHTPRPERVPHCVHYLRTGKCRNGDECVYTHSDRLAAGVETKICRDFSDYGWCERGGECELRHTYECPDFVERGKCERKGCKLLHVLRATASNEADASARQADDEHQGGMQDTQLFMRDDAAAIETAGEDEEERPAKRRRPLMQTELDDDQQALPDFLDHDEAEDEEGEQVDFTHAGKRKRPAKAFTTQQDFISFADDADYDDHASDRQDDSNEEEDDEADDDDDDVASVHSDEFELSDQEHDPPSEQPGSGESSDEDEDNDDDDDDLVDRDL